MIFKIVVKLSFIYTCRCQNRHWSHKKRDSRVPILEIFAHRVYIYILTNVYQNSLQIFSKILKNFLLINIIVKIFVSSTGVLHIVRKLSNDFLQIFQNFLEKNFKILLYLLHFNVNLCYSKSQSSVRKIYFYFLQIEKFPTCVFWISLNFSCFIEISWNFPHNLFKIPQIFQNIFKFSLLKFV